MKIGLALGSGGARALAHIGVIKVLERHKIPIDMIAGTSMAAVIGGQYAATRDIQHMEAQALKNDWKKMMGICTDFSFRHGFFRGSRLKNLIHEAVNGYAFDQLHMPFAAIATNIHNGQTIVLNEGKVADAVYASCAIPGIFQPVKFQGMTLVDGGVTCPIPVTALQQMGADIVIAVDVIPSYNPTSAERIPGAFDIINHTVTILNYHMSRNELKNADAVISPHCAAVSWTHFLSQEKTADVIRIGEEAAMEALPTIKNLLLTKESVLHKFFRALTPQSQTDESISTEEYEINFHLNN